MGQRMDTLKGYAEEGYTEGGYTEGGYIEGGYTEDEDGYIEDKGRYTEENYNCPRKKATVFCPGAKTMLSGGAGCRSRLCPSRKFSP